MLVFKNKIKDIRMAKINSPKMLSGENTPIHPATPVLPPHPLLPTLPLLYSHLLIPLPLLYSPSPSTPHSAPPLLPSTNPPCKMI